LWGNALRPRSSIERLAAICVTSTAREAGPQHWRLAAYPEPACREAAMATPETDPWAPLAERFARDHYASIRGRGRTHVIDAHLRAHLPSAPAALVDVGGGAGNQSIPLARRGYLVTIIDPSPAMLAEAQSRLAGEPAEVARRVRLVQASASQAH